MREKGLQPKCQMVWFEKNKNSLNLKFKPYDISWMGQTRKDFIQASEIHSELLFRHCSCYSDTRGVRDELLMNPIKFHVDDPSRLINDRSD
jgi:hypothetical protein